MLPDLCSILEASRALTALRKRMWLGTEVTERSRRPCYQRRCAFWSRSEVLWTNSVENVYIVFLCCAGAFQTEGYLSFNAYSCLKTTIRIWNDSVSLHDMSVMNKSYETKVARVLLIAWSHKQWYSREQVTGQLEKEKERERERGKGRGRERGIGRERERERDHSKVPSYHSETTLIMFLSKT